MKTATHTALHADRPLKRQFSELGLGLGEGPAMESNGQLPSFSAMLRSRKRGGGNEGGPPVGMVMPDMSIGAVPFYA